MPANILGDLGRYSSRHATDTPAFDSVGAIGGCDLDAMAHSDSSDDELKPAMTAMPVGPTLAGPSSGKVATASVTITVCPGFPGRLSALNVFHGQAPSNFCLWRFCIGAQLDAL